MKITVLAPYTFGYIDALVEKLKEYDGVEVNYIQYQNYRYKYNSIIDRVYNAFLKLTGTGNLKKRYITNRVLEEMTKNDLQDYILVIRPDKLEENLLLELKNNCKNLISYYFDAIAKFPKKADLITYFDKVYSYEKCDVANYKLEFITNFIPDDKATLSSTNTGVFNISSKDKRIDTLQKIALQLEEHNFDYKFIVRSEKRVELKYIDVIENYISLEETRKYVENASILLDIQKDNQEGLTFRIFEVLQFKKKLITTNSDIKNYDFYHPDNILIIDKNKPVIDPEFLIKSYQPLPETIVKRYRRSSWVEQVFELKE